MNTPPPSDGQRRLHTIPGGGGGENVGSVKELEGYKEMAVVHNMERLSIKLLTQAPAAALPKTRCTDLHNYWHMQSRKEPYARGI